MAHADGSDEDVSFLELSERSSQVANWLVSIGVERGDRVGVMVDPSMAFYATIFGIIKTGAIAVPLFTLFGIDGLRTRADDCQLRVLVVAPEK